MKLAAWHLPTTIRTYRRGLALVVTAAPGLARIYLALLLVLSLLPVVQTWLTKVLVDHLAGGDLGAGGAVQRVVVLAAFYALTMVAAAVLSPAQQTLAAWLQERTVGAIDRQLLAAGIRLPDLGRIERPAFGDELRLLQQMHYAPLTLFLFLQRGMGTLLTLIGLLLLLLRLHPLIPALLLLLSVPHLLALRRLDQLKFQAMADRSRPAREMDYCARIAPEPGAAKELRVFGLGDFFLQRFDDRWQAALREVTRLHFRQLRLFTAFDGLFAAAVAGCFWYVATQAHAGRLTLGDVALYLSAIVQAESRLVLLAQVIGMTQETTLLLQGFFSFLDGAGPCIALAAPAEALPPPDTVRFGIELRGVSFRYPESAEPVLDEVSLHSRAGTVTALVGVNGAGKSTLVKLLTRMYDPTAGEILLDGIPLRDYDLTGLRSRLAVIYQDFARFALTLGENITVGSNDPAQVDGALHRAAAASGADTLAATLPGGYATELTRRFEGGVDLSGGEWQKVALARAFIRDAALVILDEPAAALDADAEDHLFQQFRHLMVGKTALLISHRFSTVRMADQILVLEGGWIVEAGSHDDLIALGGRYAELYEMQAGRYR
jgi:ATP-binding cassette subfamily B protein